MRDLDDAVADFLIVQKPVQIGYESIRIVAEYLRGTATSGSPLLSEGTALTELPVFIHTGFAVAVHDTSICPDIEGVACGLSDDSDVQPYLYIE